MNRPLRVLHLVHHLHDTGNGIVHAALDLALAQRGLGIEVMLASAGGAYEALLAEHGIAHHQLAIGRQPLALLRGRRALARLIAEQAPDIVHAHMVTATLLAALARPRGGCRLVATVHNDFQAGAGLMALADRAIAVSEASAVLLRRRGFPRAKLRVVRNGPLRSPRTERLPPLPPVRLPQPAILAVGGLYRRKGLDILIRAFHKVAERQLAHLHLVGEGPDRALFERMAERGAGSGLIHFLGFQPQPQRYMQAADIFVLPSRREPFGLVLAEAREAGVAIVASQVDGIPEALDGGRAGLLVPPGDVAALAAALLHLLDDRQALAEAGRRAALNTGWLAAERMARETLAVYRDACPTPALGLPARSWG
ncbi:MAG: glycosyltransferase [Geminicoccaceae bacterium]